MRAKLLEFSPHSLTPPPPPPAAACCLPPRMLITQGAPSPQQHANPRPDPNSHAPRCSHRHKEAGSVQPAAHITRRSASALITALGGAFALQQRSAQAALQPAGAGAAALPGPAPTASDIYASYSYASPADILLYVRDRAPAGDAEAVLAAIDEFSTAFPMYKIGPLKGRILDTLVGAVQPALAVELGSFVGYSAVRIARALPPGGKLICVEANPECVAAMEGVLTHAGLRERVVIEPGLSTQVLPGLASKYGTAQLVFEDHCKACYAPDLGVAESTGLVGPGTWVIADNVIYPGAPDLLTKLAVADQYASTVVPAPYEYEQNWNPDWEPKADGMSISVRMTGLGQDAQAQAQQRLLGLCAELGTCTPIPDSIITSVSTAQAASKMLGKR